MIHAEKVLSNRYIYYCLNYSFIEKIYIYYIYVIYICNLNLF